MRVWVIICLLARAATVAAAPVAIENVRIWAAPDSTRVVLDLTGPVRHTVNVLSDPFRAVLDVANARLARPLTQPAAEDRYVRQLRSARHDDDIRVVLDLKKFSRVKSFQLEPNKHYGHRLVVDLFSDDEPAQRTVSADPELNNPVTRDVVIAVDAGHGGEDPGARGPNGTFEKDVVLSVARELVREINTVRGMRGVLIREGDYFMRLRKRIARARELRADLFISIHADAFRDPRVHGSSVYVLSQRGASSEHARWLAEQENASDLIGGVSLDDKDDVLASVLLDLSQTASLEASIDAAEKILSGLKRVGKVHKRRVESAAFAVLKSPDIPSILIETAYISNPDEESRLRSRQHQQRLAGAMLQGLRRYFSEFAPEGSLLAARKHIITRGDTLSGIAQHYRVSLRRLRSMNGLSSDRIRVGQVLTIPAGSDT